MVLCVVGRPDLDLDQGVLPRHVRHTCFEMKRDPLLVQRELVVLRRGGPDSELDQGVYPRCVCHTYFELKRDPLLVQ